MLWARDERGVERLRSGLLLGVVAGFGTGILLWLVGDRMLFLRHAIPVRGQVVQILAEQDEWCWGGATRRLIIPHPCTRYTARVRFDLEGGQSVELLADAGQTGRRRHGPRYRVNDFLPVVYDPADPSRASVDPRSDPWRDDLVWLAVLVTFGWVVAIEGRW